MRKSISKSEYQAIHYWINKKYGKARKCEFCDTKNSKRYEWALKKGRQYYKRIDNFIQLCPSCHRKYDYTEEQREKARERMKNYPKEELIKRVPDNTGKSRGLSPSAKKVYSVSESGEIERFDSIESACDKYGYKGNNISMCLTGRNKSAYNKRWFYD